ncbi:polysaccharide deacetylase family protein [Roseobacter sp. EG26]|uniref:polysaccharide deacetylase family protein n=1 Tax=Roseobacter sp. EG26 TaxID=3412477 RepID=UPI0026258F63|nr:polysaccharide deacetylase family protein [uncultured Roseobacter sp.]
MTAAARPVIILHGIGAPQRPLEPGEEVFWLSQAQFLAVLDDIEKMGPAAPLITFDDGNASDLAIALPELERRNLKATFFLLSGRLGQPGSLTEADVTTLAQAGHPIGLHGCDHVDWRGLDAQARKREFITAREKLSDLAGQKIETAAAPFGLYNRQTLQDLRALGFQALYTSDRGLAGEHFIRPRNCLEGGMTEARFGEALRGHVRPTRRARRFLGVARKRLLPIRTRS